MNQNSQYYHHFLEIAEIQQLLVDREIFVTESQTD